MVVVAMVVVAMVVVAIVVVAMVVRCIIPCVFHAAGLCYICYSPLGLA